MSTASADDAVLPAAEVVRALEDFYHPQMGVRAMHPADFITKRFRLLGHEGLEYR